MVWIFPLTESGERMSLRINRLRCLDCGSEINALGHIVGKKHISASNGPIICPNLSCSGEGDKNFALIGPVDFNNPKHMADVIKNNNGVN